MASFLESLVNTLTILAPIILAITFHEAAHGLVAYFLGDDTAKNLGRVTLNPFKHIDLFGTIFLPGLLFLMKSPFMFGYAKPVPVNFQKLYSPRRDMVLVAASGPLMNILLALCSAALLKVFLTPSHEVLQKALVSSIQINVVLAVFNMLPLPPLDGGRVAVGLLPRSIGYPLEKIEPYGMYILFGVALIIPMIFGFSPLGWLLTHPVNFIIQKIGGIFGLS